MQAYDAAIKIRASENKRAIIWVNDIYSYTKPFIINETKSR